MFIRGIRFDYEGAEKLTENISKLLNLTSLNLYLW